jgi:nucleoside-triphosphatase THEP1
MSKLNNQEEIIDPIEEEKPEVKKPNGKKEIKVPAGSSSKNNVIMETDDTIYLMNDGQQKAYDSIRKKVNDILSKRKRIELSDFKDTVVFDNNLSSKFSKLIPTAMWANMIGLAGRGGVGKTTVIKAIIESLQNSRYSSPNVLYIAPSHTACTVLQESLGLDSEKANDETVNTLASHLRKRPNGFGNFELIDDVAYIKSTEYKAAFGQPDILIIDESSMIGQDDIKDMVQRLVTDVAKRKIDRLPVFIFMGDYRQLGPINEQQNDFVNKGVISSTLFLDETKTDELTQVMRSDNAYLHQIYDSVGEQIIKNMEKTKNNQEPVKPSLSKYDALTTKSTSNILVVNNEKGVIQDYAEYLATNNNPYGMFWVHYNNSTNPVTKTLNQKIRSEYFKRIGLSSETPSHRAYAIGDYVENTNKVEVTLKKFNYYTEDENIIKILKNNKNEYESSTGSYKLEGGVAKPNARFKVLDIVEKKDNLSNYVSPSIMFHVGSKNIAVDVETTIVYNRQNKVRAIPKVLNLAVSFGKYNPSNKMQEGITITNYKTNTVIAKFDLPYGTYKENTEALQTLDTSKGVVSPYIPSYIGSAHTAQGNSIKNVIVGEGNIKKAATNGQTNIDDVLSALYVALTRTSGTLTVIKPLGSPIENNQDVYMGAITDTNNTIRPVAALQEVDPNMEETSFISDNVYISEDNSERFDLDSFFKESMHDDLIKKIFENKNGINDTRTILNNIYSEGTPLSKNILNLIGKTGGFGNLKIIVDTSLDSPGKYVNGIIYINPVEAIGSTDDEKLAKQRLHDVIVHELLHHVTSTLLTSDLSKLTAEQKKWVISLKNLFSTVRDKFLKDPTHKDALLNAIEQAKRSDGFLSENDKSMYYGLTSVDEFISMLMTDEGFRDLMNNTKYEGNKSILDRFIDILANILKSLGVNIRDESVLKEGLTNIVGLIQSRNQDAQIEDGVPFRSINTSKEKMILDNFEDILNILNIKSEC